MKKLLVVILSLMAQLPVYAADVPGVEAFARLPALHSATLSPDGSKIAAMLANEKGYYDVAVGEFGKFEFNIVAAMKSPRDRIGYIRWANNEKLLVAASFPEDVGGYTYFTGKLYSIDIASGESVELKPRNFKTDRRARYANNTNLLTVLPNDPDHVLLGWRTEYDEHPTVFKVNVNDGSYDVYMSNGLEIDQWFSTRDGRITFGIQYDTKFEGTGKTDTTVYKLWIPAEDGEWKVLRTIDFLNAASFNPVSLSEDGKKLMVLSNHAHDELSLHKYDIASGEFEELVYHVDGYDIDNVLFQDEKIVGVTWVEDYVRQHYFNDREKQIFELVKQTFKGAEVSIASRDMADNRFLVYAVRDNLPGTYFLLDLEKKFAAPWFSQYPELTKTKLAGNQPFRYTARDGMSMSGYFTPPINGEKNAPLVVLPHGGPWARDNRYFDFLSQFISSRGYAVLQVNFRGSSGFGTAFERAGDKQWGQAMQTDVIDAIGWVKENKFANTDNMCIVGASYGGYVALMAAALTPDMFKCAMSISGVTDIADRVEASGRLFGGEALYAKWVGDIDDPEDLEMLNRYSPINLIEKMMIPVLLFHGTNDSRVSYTQSRRFHEKATRLGKKDIDYIEVKEATHFLDDGETRLKAMQAMEEFLEDHLQD